MNPQRLRAYIFLIAVAAIWGIAGPVIKFTLGGLDPLPFLAYRFSIAAIFSIIFFIVKIKRGKKFRRLKANFPIALIYGFLAMPVSLGILFFALDKTTVLDLSLIGVIGPMMVVGGGAIFYHENITAKEKIGIAIVLVGVIFNSLFPILSSNESLRLTGNILLLIYLLADSAATLIAKKIVRQKIKSGNLTNLGFIIGAVTLVPITIIIYGAGNLLNTIIRLPLAYHLGVWYMALLSGSLAYFLYVRAQRTIEVSEAVLFNYLQPLFTIPIALIFLKETITPSFLIGAVLIAIGIAIAEYKKPR